MRRHKPMIVTARHGKEASVSDEIDNIPVHRVSPVAYIGKGPLMPTFGWHVWSSAKSADIVHLWLPQFDAAVSALAARLRGRPVLITYNCTMTGSTALSRMAAAICEFSHLLAGLLASRIVATTEDYARHSRFCRLFEHKLEVIDVPVPNWPGTLTPYRAPTKPYRIGFVGRVSPEKSIDVLLDAMEPLSRELGNEFSLEFVGPIETAMRVSIEATGSGNCIFHGQVSEEELDKFYKDIDVLVLPSNNRIEAFGLVQVEAMLRGTPCVTSDRPGMRQPVLRTGFGCLFEAGNPESLADAVLEIIRRGPPQVPDRQTLEEAFGVDRIYNRYEQLYADLSGGGEKRTDFSK